MITSLDHCIGFNPILASLHFHPNGNDFVHSAGGNVIIGKLTDAHLQHFLSKHDDLVTTVSLSPSGTYVASGQKGANSNVYVWNFSTREIIFSLEEHDHMVQHVVFAHDEKLLVTLGGPDDRKMIFWDMSSGYIVAANNKMPNGTCTVEMGAFVKDVKRRNTANYLLCSGGVEGIMLWNLDPYAGVLEGEAITGTNISRHITSIKFFDNYDHICAATTSGDFLIANIRVKRILKTVPAARMGLSSILASTEGIIVGGGDASIRYYDHNHQLRGTAKLDGGVVAMSYSPDMLEVIAGTSNGTIVRLNLETMEFIVLTESHTLGVVSVSFAPGQNDRFATASKDGYVRVWDSAEYQVMVVAKARPGMAAGAWPQCLTFAHVLISGWSDGKILAHDADNGEHLWHIDDAHPASVTSAAGVVSPGGVTALCLSRNGRFLISGGQTGDVRLWELRSRELISNLKEHNQRVTSLIILPGDSQCLSSSRDRCILRWDLRLEKRVFCMTQRMGGVNGIALAADQRTIISIGQERKLSYWDLENTTPTYSVTVDEDKDEALCVAMSNSGQMMATGSAKGGLVVWTYDSCTPFSRLVGHVGVVHGVSFSPDDKQIVTTGEDGCICIWNLFEPEG